MSTTEKILSIHKANEIHTYLETVWDKLRGFENGVGISQDISVMISELRHKVETVQECVLADGRDLSKEVTKLKSRS